MRKNLQEEISRINTIMGKSEKKIFPDFLIIRNYFLY